MTRETRGAAHAVALPRRGVLSAVPFGPPRMGLPPASLEHSTSTRDVQITGTRRSDPGVLR